MADVISRLEPDQVPERLEWDCADGGIDCRLTGFVRTNAGLAAFAREMEEAPGVRATDRAPTVEINRTENEGTGKRFELGVFIP